MKVYRSAVLLFGLLILMHFNGCGNSADESDIGGDVLAACDPPDPNLINVPNAPLPNTNCVLADQNNLGLQMPNGEIDVNSGLGDFTVGGICNGGGYTTNVISWTLMVGGVPVRNSGMVENNQTWNTTCVESSFEMRVYLEAITEDENNRTGLYNPTTNTRTQYQLSLQIIGYDANNVAHVNTTNGNVIINLDPQ